MGNMPSAVGSYVCCGLPRGCGNAKLKQRAVLAADDTDTDEVKVHDTNPVKYVGLWQLRDPGKGAPAHLHDFWGDWRMPAGLPSHSGEGSDRATERRSLHNSVRHRARTLPEAPEEEQKILLQLATAAEKKLKAGRGTKLKWEENLGLASETAGLGSENLSLSRLRSANGLCEPKGKGRMVHLLVSDPKEFVLFVFVVDKCNFPQILQVDMASKIMEEIARGMGQPIPQPGEIPKPGKSVMQRIQREVERLPKRSVFSADQEASDASEASEEPTEDDPSSDLSRLQDAIWVILNKYEDAKNWAELEHAAGASALHAAGKSPAEAHDSSPARKPRRSQTA